MKWDNEFYGHKTILSRYVGARRALPIWGYLQHGWSWGVGLPERYRFRRGFPLFVWNSVNAVATRPLSDHVVAIGAPFLYLLDMEQALAERRPTRGTIVYPFHTAPGHPHYTSDDELIESVREREHGEVTVCLYVLDFHDPDRRAAYERAGFRVVCHGHRSDPDFLWRQLREISDHRRVVSNRVGSALWYGGALSREIEVYGPHPKYAPDDDPAELDRFQRERWPEVFHPLPGNQAKVLADVELGREHLRRPEELKVLLGWSGWRRAIGPIIDAGLRSRRRAIREVRRGRTVA